MVVVIVNIKYKHIQNIKRQKLKKITFTLTYNYSDRQPTINCNFKSLKIQQIRTNGNKRLQMTHQPTYTHIYHTQSTAAGSHVFTRNVEKKQKHEKKQQTSVWLYVYGVSRKDESSCCCSYCNLYSIIYKM